MQSPWVTIETGEGVRGWYIGRKVPLGEPPPPITARQTLSASPRPSETTEAAALGRMLKDEIRTSLFLENLSHPG